MQAKTEEALCVGIVNGGLYTHSRHRATPAGIISQGTLVGDTYSEVGLCFD